MQHTDNELIVQRFFTALDCLIAAKAIRGRETFTRLYGINKRNMYTQMHQPEKDILKPVWLAYLVRDFNVSARWLLTGEGDMFTPQKRPVGRPRKTDSK